MIRARFATLACLSLMATSLGCNQRTLTSCDITQRACQESIYYRMLSLRGDGYDPFGGLPPVTVITEDEFRTQLENEQASVAATSGPSPWDKALVLLHFSTSTSAPAADGGVATDGGVAAHNDAGSDAGSGNSSIEDQVTHVYAYYDPQTKTVTIISHPTQTGEHAQEEAMITLAHELVHALQDRELDLNKEDFHTSDEYLAYDAIIEGDARFYENLFTNDVERMLGLTPSDPDVTMWPDDELDYAYTHFDELGSPLFVAKYLMYPFGAKYEATLYRSGGNAAIRHGYGKEPIRTVGFLVGPDGHAPPVGSGDVSTPPVVCALPTDGPTVGADQFGAVLFYTFLRGWGVDHDVAFAAAQTWTGDYLRVQANSDLSTTAVSWRLEFSATPPTSIAQALTASGELSVSAGSKSLQITVTDSATPLVWQASASCP
jgi:hypothetical protein